LKEPTNRSHPIKALSRKSLSANQSPPPLSLSHTRTYTHPPNPTHRRTHTHTPTDTYTHTHTHTCTHTNTHTHTHTVAKTHRGLVLQVSFRKSAPDLKVSQIGRWAYWWKETCADKATSRSSLLCVCVSVCLCVCVSVCLCVCVSVCLYVCMFV